MKFWVIWAIDALTSAITLFFFFLGLADGSVSSFNIGIWIAILAVLTVVVGGSLWLKAIGRPGLGILLMLPLAIPALLSAFFLFLFVISGSQWR